MDALYFLVDSVLTFVVYAFLLRVLLQLSRADFRNPLAQAVLALTNWLVMPLRRVLPPAGRFDTASLVALLAVQLAATLILFRLRTGGVFPVRAARHGGAALARAVDAPALHHPDLRLRRPLLHRPWRAQPRHGAARLALRAAAAARLRQVLPVVGGIDFSPLVAIVGLTALRILIG